MADANKGKKQMNTELITVIDDAFNNWFADVDRRLNYSYRNALSALNNNGLKRIIKRPHNLITVKDDNGKVIGYTIETVYTPFAKDEVSITVKDNNLIVNCGKENKEKEQTGEYIYNGVSYQTYSFSIPLDETVDVKTITAKADDGMLRINLPLKEIEEKKSDEISITIQ